MAQLARFYGRSPDRLSEREIQRYLVHLNQEKGLCHPTVKVAARRKGGLTVRALSDLERPLLPPTRARLFCRWSYGLPINL